MEGASPVGMGRGHGAGSQNYFSRPISSSLNYVEFIPEFTGDKSKTSVGEFFSCVSEICREAGWSPVMLKHIIKSRLSGAALQFFLHNPRIQNTTELSVIAEVMCQRFGDYRESRDGLREFVNCKQMDKESAKDYSIRLEILRDKVNQVTESDDGNHIGERTMFKTYYEGLSDQLQDRLSMLDIDDYETCVEAAIKFEKRLNRVGQKYSVLAIETAEGSEARAITNSSKNNGKDDCNNGGERRNVVKSKSDVKWQPSSDTARGRGSYVKGNKDFSHTRDKNKSTLESGSRGYTDKSERRVFDSSKIYERNKGNRLEGNKLVVKLLSRGKSLNAVLDIASDVSLITVEAIDIIKLGKHIYTNETLHIAGVAKNVLKSNKYIDIKFSYKECGDIYLHRFVVVDRGDMHSIDILLGNDYIAENKGVIDINKKQLWLQGAVVSEIEIVNGERLTAAFAITTIANDDEKDNVASNIVTNSCGLHRSAIAVFKAAKKEGITYMSNSVRETRRLDIVKNIVRGMEGDDWVREEGMDLLMAFKEVIAMDASEVGKITDVVHTV